MFERTRSFLQRLTGSWHGTAAPGAEGRIWVRYPSDRQTVIRLEAADAEPMVAKVQDVSRGEIRLLLHQDLDLGAMILVELPARGDQPPTMVQASVVDEKPGSDAGWLYTCRFATDLSEEELPGLGARLQRPLGVEKREGERLPSRGKVVFRVINCDDVERSAPIHNVSSNGVAFVLPEQIDPGRLLSIHLHDDADTPVLSIVACVVFMSNWGGGKWMIGCNFIRELDGAELAAVVK
jgi:hypothetical protein